jgi:hypothetical protein
VDPNVFLTVVFVSWVALFALAVVAVVRHERSHDSAARAEDISEADVTHAEDERRISDGATLGR